MEGGLSGTPFGIVEVGFSAHVPFADLQPKAQEALS